MGSWRGLPGRSPTSRAHPQDPKQEVNSREARRTNIKTLLCAKRGEKNKILLCAKRGENFDKKNNRCSNASSVRIILQVVEFDEAVLERVIF